MLVEAVGVLFTDGESTFDVIPDIPYISYPSSAIFFSIFGAVLYKKWKFNAPLMLFGAYGFWESVGAPTSFYLNGSNFHWVINSIWILLVILAYVVVKPKINLNNWSVVFLFYVYANEGYPWQAHHLFVETMTQIALGIFIWKSFNPKENHAEPK